MSKLFVNGLSEVYYPLCATGYRRTRAHLLTWKAVLPKNVKQAAMYLSRDQTEAPVSPHSGSWLFLYENVPQLKYHNPDVKFLFEAHQEETSRLCFTADDGTETVLDTTHLRQRAIQTLVDKFIKGDCHDDQEKHTHELGMEQ